MSNKVGEDIVRNFKSRLLMRYGLLQSSINANDTELVEIKNFFQSMPNELLPANELDNFIAELEKEGSFQHDELQRTMDELEYLQAMTWQQMYELQEHFLNVLIVAYERPMEIRRQCIELMRKLSEKALRKAKAASRKKIPPPPLDPVKEYSTPHITAMQAAIHKFWLDFDEDNLPTQKQVSNFIAEQIGEPIRNRMTDDLAKAIRPVLEK